MGELATGSDLFRTLWGSHDVRVHRTGAKQVHHPVVGDLDLTFEAMDLTSEAGLQLLAFTAAPGSASQDGLQLLATWAATAQLESDRAILQVTDTADKPYAVTRTDPRHLARPSIRFAISGSRAHTAQAGAMKVANRSRIRRTTGSWRT